MLGIGVPGANTAIRRILGQVRRCMSTKDRLAKNNNQQQSEIFVSTRDFHLSSTT